MKSIVETERAYVADVEVLHEVFVRPLLEASLVSSPQNKSGCVKTQTSLGENLEVPTKLLSGKLATFLSEIETIYTLNLEFLEDLEGILDAWCGSDTMIGEVFQNYASLFKLYGEYAKGHGYASEKLTSDDFNEYVTACAKDPRCQEQLSIDMFLLKPLERVPSYIVLLNHLLDVTPLTHPDQRQLKLSLEKFYEVSNSIDETIRLDRNQSKIREIENRFASEMKLAHHKREFIREGYLNKVDRTGRAQRYIFHLFNDILIYSSITPRKMLKLHQTLQIRGMSVSGEIEHMFSHCIRIHSNPKSFIVFADSASEKEEWLRDLNNVIERSSQSIASEDNVQDSFIAPVWKSDNLVEYCQRCFVQFGLTTRRHHCRKWYTYNLLL